MSLPHSGSWKLQPYCVLVRVTFSFFHTNILTGSMLVRFFLVVVCFSLFGRGSCLSSCNLFIYVFVGRTFCGVRTHTGCIRMYL